MQLARCALIFALLKTGSNSAARMAMVAIATVPAVPADPDALATFPWLHSFAQKIDNSNDLMSRHTRILNTGPEPFFD